MNKKVTIETKRALDRVFDTISPGDEIPPNYLKKVFVYQGRKSPLIAKKVLTGITREGDVILDPFFGSGSFLIAASELDRKIDGVELDNYTFSIVKILLTKVDFTKFYKLFKKLENKVKNKVMDLYATQVNGEPNYIKMLYFDQKTNEYFNPRPNRCIIDGKNITLVKRASNGDRYKQFDNYDLVKLRDSERIDTHRFPSHCFIENSRINITSETGANRYDRNFTNRAKAALLYIQDAITELPSCPERDMLEFALVSSLALSKITMYGSGTDNLYHVIKFCCQESNVWEVFANKIKNFITYKKTLKRILQENFDEKIISIFNEDYEDFLSRKNILYDCIYTDPPYSDQVPYLEKSQYFRDWLRSFYDRDKFALTQYHLDKEIVYTNANIRSSKNFRQYLKDMDHVFDVLSNKLKENKFLVLTLKLGTAHYFNLLSNFIDSAKKYGLELAGRYAIDIADPSIRRQAAYLATTATQIIVIFQKMPIEKRCWYINDLNVESFIRTKVYRLIDGSPEKHINLSTCVEICSTEIQNIVGVLLKPIDLEKIRQVISQNFSVQNGVVFFDNNELYLGLENDASLLVKLYDIIPLLIRRLLNDKEAFTLDDLYSEIAFVLLDEDPRFVSLFINNPQCRQTINNFLDNYCEIRGNKYVRRTVHNSREAGSIDISTMEAYDFERLIKSLFEREGFTDVLRIGQAGDRGVDIIATERLPNGTRQKVFIQCKRWSADVGSEPIQRLHSMMIVNGAQRAICVTTSYFTREGKAVARDTNVEMINGEELLIKLQRRFGNTYYHAGISDSSR